MAKKLSLKKKAASKNDSQPEQDIIEIILEHHKPLKELIKIMKDEDATFSKKREAFREFAPTLIAHAKPEEKSLYANFKKDNDMKIEGLEGDVEHALADQLCEELKATRSEDLFMAKVKVLAELVEHHIEEEEEEMFPDFKKNSTKEEREKLGAKYLKLRAEFVDEDESAPSPKGDSSKHKRPASQPHAH